MCYIGGEKMKLVVDRYGIRIVPENKIDEAYIEDTLGLKEKDSSISLKRVNSMGLSCIAYLETKK